jgi:hypothetical protein
LISTASIPDYQETDSDPYSLPGSHPAFSKLTELFNKIKRPLNSEEPLKTLGFVFPKAADIRNRAKVIIGTHPSKSLSKYIFKFYICKKDKSSIRLKERCYFSRKAQKVIKEMRLKKYFFVPKKHLFYFKKEKGEESRRFMLIEDKVSFLESDKSSRFWKSTRVYDYLLPVAKLIWNAQIKDLQPSNLKRNSDGKMTLFDTELGYRGAKASFIAIDYWLRKNQTDDTWDHQRFGELWEKACETTQRKSPYILKA